MLTKSSLRFTSEEGCMTVIILFYQINLYKKKTADEMPAVQCCYPSNGVSGSNGLVDFLGEGLLA